MNTAGRVKGRVAAAIAPSADQERPAAVIGAAVPSLHQTIKARVAVELAPPPYW